MKKFLNAISGRTALIVFIVIAAVCSVLEIVTSVKNNANIDFAGLATIWVAIAGWAACLTSSKKKEDEKKENK